MNGVDTSRTTGYSRTHQRRLSRKEKTISAMKYMAVAATRLPGNPDALLFLSPFPGEPFRGLIGDDVVTGEVGVAVAEPAGEMPEDAVEFIVHHDDAAAVEVGLE